MGTHPEISENTHFHFVGNTICDNLAMSLFAFCLDLLGRAIVGAKGLGHLTLGLFQAHQSFLRQLRTAHRVAGAYYEASMRQGKGSLIETLVFPIMQRHAPLSQTNLIRKLCRGAQRGQTQGTNIKLIPSELDTNSLPPLSQQCEHRQDHNICTLLTAETKLKGAIHQTQYVFLRYVHACMHAGRHAC